MQRLKLELIRWLHDLSCHVWYEATEMERRLGLPAVVSEALYRWHLRIERRLLMLYFPGEQFFINERGCYS